MLSIIETLVKVFFYSCFKEVQKEKTKQKIKKQKFENSKILKNENLYMGVESGTYIFNIIEDSNAVIFIDIDMKMRKIQRFFILRYMGGRRGCGRI